MPITLTKTTPDDLHCLYQIQLDDDAKHLDDASISMWTIRIEQRIVGSVAKFVIAGDAGITYWIDKEFWGQGIATDAAASTRNRPPHLWLCRF